MRKVISLLLSIAMLVTMVSMLAVSSNATGETVSNVIMDFEDQTGIGPKVGDTATVYKDNSTLSDTFSYWKATAGDYSAAVNGKNNFASFILPENWWSYYDADRDFTFTKPNAITFEITNSNSSKSAQVGLVGFDKKGSNEGLAESDITTLARVGSNTAAAKTKATITSKIPASIDVTQYTRFIIRVWGTNDSCYIDNITLVYPTSFTATFSGTETAVLENAVADKTVDFVAGEETIKLPEATLSGGKTLAGWTTASDPETVIPANTVVALEEDVDYFAVATDRPAYEAPAAPTVSSLEATKVTLEKQDNYQYSMDGSTWQDSNVFAGLSVGTEYTFYQRVKSDAAYLTSASSEGTTVTTPVVYTFEAESVYSKTSGTYSGTVGTNNPGSDGTAGSQTYMTHDASSPAVGHFFTLNLSGLQTGVYQVSLYSRNVANSRSVYSVTAYDTTETEQNLGSIDFADLSSKITGTYYCNPTLTNTASVTEGTTLKVKFTMTTARTNGAYIDKIVLTKVADYVADPYKEIAGTTNAAAQLRIGNLNGIRFITNVNANKVAAAETAGYTVTFGTLIAPVDLVEGELSFDSSDYIDVVSGGYFKYNSGEVAGSIVGIKTDNVARDFIARGYVKLTKDETTTVYYATQPNEGRSLKTVAAACVADSSFFNMLNDAQKEQVTTWATWANA